MSPERQTPLRIIIPVSRVGWCSDCLNRWSGGLQHVETPGASPLHTTSSRVIPHPVPTCPWRHLVHSDSSQDYGTLAEAPGEAGQAGLAPSVQLGLGALRMLRALAHSRPSLQGPALHRGGPSLEGAPCLSARPAGEAQSLPGQGRGLGPESRAPPASEGVSGGRVLTVSEEESHRLPRWPLITARNIYSL